MGGQGDDGVVSNGSQLRLGNGPSPGDYRVGRWRIHIDSPMSEAEYIIDLGTLNIGGGGEIAAVSDEVDVWYCKPGVRDPETQLGR